MSKTAFDLIGLVVLIAFLSYLLVRARRSEKLQREAVERGRQSVPKIEESVGMQKESLAELRKTNQLLAEIASALKSRNEKT